MQKTKRYREKNNIFVDKYILFTFVRMEGHLETLLLVKTTNEKVATTCCLRS